MNERVLLSICIPTYNGSRFLSETVENVVSQIEDADAENAIEVIVCDNASEDRVPEIAREYDTIPLEGTRLCPQQPSLPESCHHEPREANTLHR